MTDTLEALAVATYAGAPRQYYQAFGAGRMTGRPSAKFVQRSLVLQLLHSR
jgi:hypothetical protein